ncbi:MAG: hypothetical protein Q4C28_10740, partial [Escherichia coli]|nr:hypothetical protein [Escherichia coli]
CLDEHLIVHSMPPGDSCFHVIVSVHKWQFDDSSPDFLCRKRKDFLLPACSKRKVSRLIIFWQGNHDV